MHSYTRVGIFLLAFTPLFLYSAEKTATPHYEIMKILSGTDFHVPTIPVEALCRSLAKQNDKKGGATNSDSKISYVDEGKCNSEKVSIGEVRSVWTPLSEGGSFRHFIYDFQKMESLVRQLGLIDKYLAESSKVSAKTKLDLQQTIWELYAGLDYRRYINLSPEAAIDQKEVDRLLLAAKKVMKKVLLSDAEIAELDNFEEVSKLVGERGGINLFSQKPVFEEVYTWQLHSQASGGRLSARIFLTAQTDEDKKRLKQELDQSGLIVDLKLPDQNTKFNQERLSLLPERVGTLATILVLNFNALGEDLRVHQVPYVAEWGEVWYSGVVDHLEEEIDSAASKVSFFKMIYLKGMAGDQGEKEVVSSSYRVVPDFTPSRTTLVDVAPTYGGMKVTTMKGSCVGCHAFRVRSFWSHEKRLMFVNFNDELVDKTKVINKYGESHFVNYRAKAEASLREWLAK